MKKSESVRLKGGIADCRKAEELNSEKQKIEI
jgi:hypothetical protein